MVTTKNLIKYIKQNINEFDICSEREITNNKLVIRFRLRVDPDFKFNDNLIVISRYDKQNYDVCRCSVQPFYYIEDISEEEADELYFLFKSIKNRIKEEIVKEILSV